jgi:hypothetical protein
MPITENVNGFLLDKGFQVFIDIYPEAIKLFNYNRLNLCSFSPGALAHFTGPIEPTKSKWGSTP